MVCVVSSAMDLLKRQSSVFQLNGKLKAVILIGGPHVGEFILLNLLDVRVATIVNLWCNMYCVEMGLHNCVVFSCE